MCERLSCAEEGMNGLVRIGSLKRGVADVMMVKYIFRCERLRVTDVMMM
jgi:hypothetical protein